MTDHPSPREDGRIRVSVALCTRNGSRFIREQLESILAQSVRPDEVVVSDDDSGDDTLRLVESVFARHAADGVSSRILRHAPPLGVTRNFESAISACTGDLIVLSDQDDVWHPDRIERMAAEFAARSELLLAFSDARLVNADGAFLGESLFQGLGIREADKRELRDGDAYGVLLTRNLATGATMMFRRELAALAAPFPESWLHDEWLAVMAAATGRIRLLDDLLIDYRQHGRNEVGAGSLSFSGKLGRLREPGAGRNQRLLVRAEALRDRLRSLPVPAPERVLERAEEKLAHEQVRSAIPRARLRRPAPVIREWRTGRYVRYGLGAQDVLRDLVQPLSEAGERPGRS